MQRDAVENSLRCSDRSVKMITNSCAKRDSVWKSLRCSESSVKIITSRCAKIDDRCATRDVLDFAALRPDAFYVWLVFLILILVLFSRLWLLHLMADLWFLVVDLIFVFWFSDCSCFVESELWSTIYVFYFFISRHWTLNLLFILLGFLIFELILKCSFRGLGFQRWAMHKVISVSFVPWASVEFAFPVRLRGPDTMLYGTGRWPCSELRCGSVPLL